MKPSNYQREKTNNLKEEAYNLYKLGFSTRRAGKILGKSHQWISLAVKEKRAVDKSLTPVKPPDSIG